MKYNKLQDMGLGVCSNCLKESKLISGYLGLCKDCIIKDFSKLKSKILKLHYNTRKEFSLPLMPPKAQDGKICKMCVNECLIPKGGKGFCGIWQNKDGKLSPTSGNPKYAIVEWYHDSLPTNCCADWVCAGGTGSAGYPKYSYSKGAEYGYKSLAVFYGACNFNCLFCQNWHFKQRTTTKRFASAIDLVNSVDEKTSCICYFGGDPTPQISHALEVSRLARERRKEKHLRICWETNGAQNPQVLKKMMGLSLESGGCIKIDLKAWTEALNIALCGVTNKRSLENFKILSGFIKERPDPPPLIATSLLVPGYVDEIEIKNIAGFIASLNPNIPYSLLGFHPHFYMNDLPTTSRNHANKCKVAAEAEGLKNVRIGNIHLLSNAY